MLKHKNNVLVLILGSVASSWNRLSQVVANEGNRIGGPIDKQDLEDCQAECDKEPRCHSVTYCKENNICYLYDKRIYGGEGQTSNADCFTSYKSYSGKFLIVIYIIAALY